MNPYNWQSHRPRIEIPRQAVERVAATLREGGGAVVIGGRGMGKSVFLRQVRAVLEQDHATRVVLVPAPPPQLSVETCLDELASGLGVSSATTCLKILDAYFTRAQEQQRLILLFDEFDRYAHKGPSAEEPPGRGFFNDLEAARRELDGLGVLAAGSLGVFVVRDVLGSSFLSRALHAYLSSFERQDVDRLAVAFAERGDAVRAEVFDALYLATGGIPALLTYGLQQLWGFDREAVERDVVEIYGGFQRDYDDYLKDLLRSVADPRLSEVPRRVLRIVQESDGEVARSELEEAVGAEGQSLALDLVDALRLLEAGGLVRTEGVIQADDPVLVRPITSLLDLPSHSRPADSLSERLLGDLKSLLAKLHRASADFFRPTGERKTMVPESVFASHLALGFELLGWQVEREAQSAAGRTDLKLRRNASPDVLLVEVKLWGRNDYREAQRQIESYWTADVRHGAVVQLTSAEIPDWIERYPRECLEPFGLTFELRKVEGSPVTACFACTSEVAGMAVSVDHYLLRLPRRR